MKRKKMYYNIVIVFIYIYIYNGFSYNPFFFRSSIIDLKFLIRLTNCRFCCCKLLTFFWSIVICRIASDQYSFRCEGDNKCSGLTCFKCFGLHMYFLGRCEITLIGLGDNDCTSFISSGSSLILSSTFTSICSTGADNSAVIAP